MPPCSPQKAFKSAAELMYVTGVIVSSGFKTSDSSCHERSTFERFAMSAIEQPADRSGSMAVCSGLDRISATSAIKWTPQNTK